MESSSEDDSDDEDDFNLVDFYELSEDGTEASVTDSTGILGSKKLPIYDRIVGNTPTPTIIDSGCSTIFVSEEIAKKASLNIQPIALRRVRVADRHILMATGIATFEMKLENLPTEIITAYIFPLRRIGLVLGLPWLSKHNSHMDFRTLSYEFTRNRRRYQLNLLMKELKLRLASPEECNAFRDDNTNFFLLTLYSTVKSKAIGMGKILQVKRQKLIR
jgi:hypothetical protein